MWNFYFHVLYLWICIYTHPLECSVVVNIFYRILRKMYTCFMLYRYINTGIHIYWCTSILTAKSIISNSGRNRTVDIHVPRQVRGGEGGNRFIIVAAKCWKIGTENGHWITFQGDCTTNFGNPSIPSSLYNIYVYWRLQVDNKITIKLVMIWYWFSLCM